MVVPLPASGLQDLAQRRVCEIDRVVAGVAVEFLTSTFCARLSERQPRTIFVRCDPRQQSAVMNVGYIGLGAMGGALANHLVRKHSLTVLDLNRDTVWSVAEKLDLRPLGLLSVDDTWSAFRFRRAAPAS